MSPMRLAGLVLVVVGIVLLLLPLTYKSQEDVFTVGGMRATIETKKTVPLQPLLGGLALAGGVALVILGKKKS